MTTHPTSSFFSIRAQRGIGRPMRQFSVFRPVDVWVGCRLVFAPAGVVDFNSFEDENNGPLSEIFEVTAVLSPDYGILEMTSRVHARRHVRMVNMNTGTEHVRNLRYVCENARWFLLKEVVANPGVVKIIAFPAHS